MAGIEICGIRLPGIQDFRVMRETSLALFWG
jgi:hypothetical protein